MSAKAGEEKRGQDGSSQELWLEVSGAQFDAGKMQWREEYLFGGQAETQTCSHSHKQAQPDTYVSHKDVRTRLAAPPSHGSHFVNAQTILEHEVTEGSHPRTERRTRKSPRFNYGEDHRGCDAWLDVICGRLDAAS